MVKNRKLVRRHIQRTLGTFKTVQSFQVQQKPRKRAKALMALGTVGCLKLRNALKAEAQTYPVFLRQLKKIIIRDGCAKALRLLKQMNLPPLSSRAFLEVLRLGVDKKKKKKIRDDDSIQVRVYII